MSLNSTESKPPAAQAQGALTQMFSAVRLNRKFSVPAKSADLTQRQKIKRDIQLMYE